MKDIYLSKFVLSRYADTEDFLLDATGVPASGIWDSQEVEQNENRINFNVKEEGDENPVIHSEVCDLMPRDGEEEVIIYYQDKDKPKDWPVARVKMPRRRIGTGGENNSIHRINTLTVIAAKLNPAEQADMNFSIVVAAKLSTGLHTVDVEIVEYNGHDMMLMHYADGGEEETLFEANYNFTQDKNLYFGYKKVNSDNKSVEYGFINFM